MAGYMVTIYNILYRISQRIQGAKPPDPTEGRNTHNSISYSFPDNTYYNKKITM